jgi:hypothetical protein
MNEMMMYDVALRRSEMSLYLCFYSAEPIDEEQINVMMTQTQYTV